MIFTPRPVVVGHRGFGKGIVDGHAENTVDSFRAAVDAGLSWVEVDASRAADDELVVVHNPSTPDGAFVVEQTAAELAAKGIPRLRDVLDALPAEVGVNIDVKTTLEDATTSPGRTTFGLLTGVLRTERERRPLLVTSFDPAALLHLRAEAPGVPLGLISWVKFPLRMAVSAAAHLHLDVVCLHWDSFGPNSFEPGPVHRPPAQAVALAHDAGLEVMAWCPEVTSARTLVAAGVDAVVVNDVPGAVAALSASAR